MKKQRLDHRLVADGLVPDLRRAAALIMAGQVLVNDTAVTTAGAPIRPDAVVRLRAGADDDWASRGARKLAPALETFSVDVSERVCVDVGASTGGFTDVLLQAGARRVYAVDVGYGQLIQRLANDARVVVMDRTNARTLTPDAFDPSPTLAVVDVSFIRLGQILPALVSVLAPPADLLLMVKPQFEVERTLVEAGGVVRDPAVRRRAVDGVVSEAAALGCRELARRDNDIRGPKGNLETFLHLVLDRGVDPALLA